MIGDARSPRLLQRTMTGGLAGPPRAA